MADNITYRFIQNVGDYFPSGYFSEDFITKVQKCAGLSADEMKSLCSPYVQIRSEYEEYKNFIINGHARKEDEIKQKLRAGMTRRQVAQDTGMSIFSLYNYINQTPELKQALEAVRNA